ncbi:MAG TPA: hypothetical protein VIZ87_06020 [Terrimicrobium sp.]
MKPKTTLRRALSDPQLLGNVLAGETWSGWRPMLLACMGEPLEPSELEIFRRFTGRDQSPSAPVDEAVFVIGRRGGKDRTASVLAAYFAGLCDHSSVLAPGEKAVLIVLAPDTRQAKVQLDYIEGAFQASPILAQRMVNRTADTLELDNNVLIEVRSASFRRIRGVTSIAVIASEAAFWLSEESSNPDTEILNAIRPSLATTRGPLIIISSPYARRGEVWSLYDRHFGEKGDPRVLVVQGSSRDFNPTLPQEVIDRAYQADPASAAAEYGGQFRTDIERFITIEALRDCLEPGVGERAPEKQKSYIAFTDPSGGSGDSFGLAIAHVEGDTVVLDCIRERRSPFSPEQVVGDFADTLKSYRISRVVGDRYGGVWPAEQFKKCGIIYEASDRTKSQLYFDLLPLINSSQIRLIDNDRLVHQLVSLERRTARGGRDSIDHPPGARDDVANAVAGVASLANRSTSLMSQLIADAFTDKVKPLWI